MKKELKIKNLRVKNQNSNRFQKDNMKKKYLKLNKFMKKRVSLFSLRFFLTKRNKIYIKILKMFRKYNRKEEINKKHKRLKINRRFPKTKVSSHPTKKNA